MKNLKNFLKIFLICLLFSNVCYSETPTYTLKVKNFTYVTSTDLRFDIYLKNTTADPNAFEYSMGQFVLNVAPNFITGTPSYTVVSSGLPGGVAPGVPVVIENQLRIKTINPQGPGNGYIISSTGDGTLIARMNLHTTGQFNCGPSITWRNSIDGGFYTKLIAYTYNSINPGENITTPAAHSIEGSPGWTLNLTAFLQYNTCAENFTVELRDAIAPHAVVHSQNTVFNVNGIVKTGSISVPCNLTGSYYVVLKHWNSLETWSNITVTFPTGNYDFSTGVSPIYCNNHVFLPGTPNRFSLHRGDVNQDGVIDLDDVNITQNASDSSITGDVPTDLNCDGVVNIDDISILDNELYRYSIIVSNPSGIIPNSFVNRPGNPYYCDVRNY